MPRKKAASPLLALDAIRVDPSLRARAEHSQAVVDAFATFLVENPEEEMPAVVVFQDGPVHWLADGFYRVAAYRQAGRPSVPAKIVNGDRKAALFFALTCNAEHGVRRTEADEELAVRRLLADPIWRTWTAEEIRCHCKVSRAVVERVRSA